MNRLEINHTPPPCGKSAGGRSENQITMIKERIEKEEYRAIYHFLSEEKCPFQLTTSAHLNEFYGVLFPIFDLGLFTEELPESDTWLPSAVETIQRIQTLDLSGLTIKDLPFSFDLFSNLEELSFNSSFFWSHPIGFSTLPKLKYLDLSHLKWYAEFPNLQGLKNLEVLVLRGLDKENSTLPFLDGESFPDDMFSGLTNLRVLDLRYSRLDSFSFFKSLEGLKNLEHVDLRSASYTNPIPSLDCEILTGKDLGSS